MHVCRAETEVFLKGSGFDVLLVPGGSAKAVALQFSAGKRPFDAREADWRTLGSEGCEAVRRFVRSGHLALGFHARIYSGTAFQIVRVVRSEG